MIGNTMGSLELQYSTGTNWTELWKVSGDKGRAKTPKLEDAKRPTPVAVVQSKLLETSTVYTPCTASKQLGLLCVTTLQGSSWLTAAVTVPPAAVALRFQGVTGQAILPLAAGVCFKTVSAVSTYKILFFNWKHILNTDVRLHIHISF